MGHYMGQVGDAEPSVVSKSHWMPASTLDLGMMGSDLSSSSCDSNCLDRASGFIFLESSL